MGMLLEGFVPNALLFHPLHGAHIVDPVLGVQHDVLVGGLLLLQDFDGPEYLGNSLLVRRQVGEGFVSVLGLL